jgi:hypothetical protein
MHTDGSHALARASLSPSCCGGAPPPGISSEPTTRSGEDPMLSAVAATSGAARARAALSFLLLLWVPASALAQIVPASAGASASTTAAVATATKPLSIADYARWRTIQTPVISADGAWVAWAYTQTARRMTCCTCVTLTAGASTRSSARRGRSSPTMRAGWRTASRPPSPKIEKLERDRQAGAAAGRADEPRDRREGWLGQRRGVRVRAPAPTWPCAGRAEPRPEA